MAKKSNSDGKAIFIAPSALAEIKAELEDLSTMEPGSKPVKEAIGELLPVIRGCRARGHSWNRIAGSFQKQVNGVSSVLLRRYAYELDPSLKEPVKNLAPKAPKAAKTEKKKQEQEQKQPQTDTATVKF